MHLSVPPPYYLMNKVNMYTETILNTYMDEMKVFLSILCIIGVSNDC